MKFLNTFFVMQSKHRLKWGNGAKEERVIAMEPYLLGLFDATVGLPDDKLLCCQNVYHIITSLMREGKIKRVFIYLFKLLVKTERTWDAYYYFGFLKNLS